MTVEKTISAGGRLTAGSTPLRRLWAERRQLYAESDAALKINTEDGDKRSTALAGAVLSLDQTIGYVPAIDLGDVLIKLKSPLRPSKKILSMIRSPVTNGVSCRHSTTSRA